MGPREFATLIGVMTEHAHPTGRPLHERLAEWGAALRAQEPGDLAADLVYEAAARLRDAEEALRRVRQIAVSTTGRTADDERALSRIEEIVKRAALAAGPQEQS